MTDIRSFAAGVPVAGATLFTEIHVPIGSGPRPALLMRTPYGAHDAQRGLYAHPSWYAREGFAVAVQDVRGRWRSEGSFEPFRNEAADGLATVQWISQQKWCTGWVGMYGMSYPGFTQLSAASRRPSALKAIAPAMTGADPWADWMYEAGVLSLSTVPFWAVVLGIDGARRAGDLPALEELQELVARPETLYARFGTVDNSDLMSPAAWSHVPFLADWLEHDQQGSYWSDLVAPDLLEHVDVPALHVAGWYDVMLGGTLRTHRRLVERGVATQRLLIGPWAHEPWSRCVGELDLGVEADNCVDETQRAWFSHCLDDRPLDTPPVRAFVLGRNRWAEEDAWPPPRATTIRLYLRSDGRANSLGGTGRLDIEPAADEPPDVFVHDPRAPLRTLGGRGCSTSNGEIVGPRDQRPQESRRDILVYDGPCLTEPLVVAGEITCDLFVGVDGSCGDFIVRLVRVTAEGPAICLTDSVMRILPGNPPRSAGGQAASGSNGVVRARMSIGHTYVELGAGERLRVEIGGSSHPRYARNWNGQPPHLAPTAFGEATTTQRVFHDARFPSAGALPVLR